MFIQVQYCPICRGNATIIDNVRTINPQAEDTVELLECNVCGHWWHSPIPDQGTLLSLYESTSPYVVGAGAHDSYGSAEKMNLFHRFILAKLGYPSPGRLYLEIGSGGGQLLRRFRRMGYECHGVDPGQWVPDESVYQSMEDLPNNMKFDVFVMQDVLEHVVDPLGLMGQLHGKANPGALLFASFPCCTSRPAQLRKGGWGMVMPYGHLHYYSHESARLLFQKAGWVMRETILSRHQDLLKLFMEFSWKYVLYDALKGGRDQLYVFACA